MPPEPTSAAPPARGRSDPDTRLRVGIALVALAFVGSLLLEDWARRVVGPGVVGLPYAVLAAGVAALSGIGGRRRALGIVAWTAAAVALAAVVHRLLR